MTDIGPAPTYTDTTGKRQTAEGVFFDFQDDDVLRVVVIDLDTDGDPVPTYLPTTFTYDGQNNLQTATLTNGTNTWVRTYTISGGNQTADSGWVKQ